MGVATNAGVDASHLNVRSRASARDSNGAEETSSRIAAQLEYQNDPDRACRKLNARVASFPISKESRHCGIPVHQSCAMADTSSPLRS